LYRQGKNTKPCSRRWQGFKVAIRLLAFLLLCGHYALFQVIPAQDMPGAQHCGFFHNPIFYDMDAIYKDMLYPLQGAL